MSPCRAELWLSPGTADSGTQRPPSGVSGKLRTIHKHYIIWLYAHVTVFMIVVYHVIYIYCYHRISEYIYIIIYI